MAEANHPLNRQAAALNDGRDDTVSQCLLSELLRDPGQGADTGVVTKNRIATAMLVRGGELIVDDQLITLRESGSGGAWRGDETWIRCRVVDVKPEVPLNGAGVIRPVVAALPGEPPPLLRSSRLPPTPHLPPRSLSFVLSRPC